MPKASNRRRVTPGTPERQVVRRLPKEARRAQLLDVAYEIIKNEGTGALALGRLAETAGVSKPIVYDHFGTRAGLLVALFRSFDEQQVQRMRAALDTGGDSLAATTKIAAAGYMDCQLSTGPEYPEICAALLAYEETKDYLQESRDYFVEEYRRVFSPFVALEGARGRGILTGLVGAAEGLARDTYNGTLSSDQAIETLVDIMLATLTPLTPLTPLASPNRPDVDIPGPPHGPEPMTDAARRPGRRIASMNRRSATRSETA